MTTNAPRKAFSTTTEDLAGCRLTASLAHEQALAIAEMLSTSEPWVTLKFSATSLAAYLTREDPALRRFVVSVEGDLAGIICIRTPWLRGPYIELLGFFPHHRGKGIGRQVLAWAETEARRESRNLWVAASSFNQPALNFYQRLGFQPIGPIQGLVTPEYDEILLRKCLT